MDSNILYGLYTAFNNQKAPKFLNYLVFKITRFMLKKEK